ncbi:MAG: carboxypeptidase-like regulatory domain-containing protein, partial [Zymomonas mobilis subsp. pomaceae]
MRKYFDSVASALDGKPVIGALIYLYNADNSLASLFSDDGLTPISQPLRTDSLGYFEFYAPDGLYTLTITYGGKVQLSISGVQIYDELHDAENAQTSPDNNLATTALSAAANLTQFIKNYSNNSM